MSAPRRSATIAAVLVISSLAVQPLMLRLTLGVQGQVLNVAFLMFIAAVSAFYLHRSLYRRRQGPTPLGLYLLSWILSIGFYLWNPLHLYALRPATWGMFALGISSFGCAYALVTVASRSEGTVPPPPRSGFEITPTMLRATRRLWRICLVLGSLLFVLYLRSFLRGFSFSSLGGRLLEVRTGLNNGQVPLGFYYFYFFELLVPLSLILATIDKRSRLKYVLTSMGAFLSLILTSGRTNIGTALLLVAFVGLFREGAQRLRTRTIGRIAGVSLLGLALFVGIGTVIGKSYSNSGLRTTALHQPTSLPTQLRLPYLYYVGSLPAFDQLANGHEQNLQRGVTYRPFFQLGHLADRQIQVPSKVQRFYSIPYSFNVTTYLGPLLRDGGLLGILLGSVAMGAFCALIYAWWVRAPSPATLCLVALVGTLAFSSPGDLGWNELSWLLQVAMLAATAYLGVDRSRFRPTSSTRLTTPESSDSPSSLMTTAGSPPSQAAQGLTFSASVRPHRTTRSARLTPRSR